MPQDNLVNGKSSAITILEQELAKIVEEIKSNRLLLIPPASPNILTPGTTKEDVAEYEEKKKAYDELDIESIKQTLQELNKRKEEVNLAIKQQHQKKILHNFKQDCDRANNLLANAWLEVERIAELYSSQPQISAYHQGYGCGNPLRMDMELERLKLQYPCLEIQNNRLAICPRSKSRDKKINTSDRLL